MQCISFVTRDLITKEKLEEILKLAGFKYELGGYKPYANFRCLIEKIKQY